MKKLTKKGLKRECEKLWRGIIRKMFNNQCAVCGSKKCLNAHHIFSKGGHPATRYELLNGVLLCFRCHLSVHGGDPIIIQNMLKAKFAGNFDTNDYEKLVKLAKSGSCKHDYGQVREDLQNYYNLLETAKSI